MVKTFVVAELPENGMIYIRGRRISGKMYGCAPEVFHLGDGLHNFRSVESYDDVVDAQRAATTEASSFVMEFTDDEVAQLWFNEDKGLVERLARWHACYGHYPTTLYE